MITLLAKDFIPCFGASFICCWQLWELRVGPNAETPAHRQSQLK